jgi:hypothetical protein
MEHKSRWAGAIQCQFPVGVYSRVFPPQARFRVPPEVSPSPPFCGVGSLVVEWYAQRVVLVALVSTLSTSLAWEPWRWGSRRGGGWGWWCRVPNQLFQKCLEALYFRARDMSAWWGLSGRWWGSEGSCRLVRRRCRSCGSTLSSGWVGLWCAPRAGHR